MFCSNCGTSVNETDKFCPECGAPIERPIAEEQTVAAAAPAEAQPEPERTAIPIPEPQPAPAPAPAPKKKSHKALWIILTCVALAAVIAAVVFFWHPWKTEDARTNPQPGSESTAVPEEQAEPEATPVPLTPEEAVRAAFVKNAEINTDHVEFIETVNLTIGIPSVGFSQGVDVAVVLNIDAQKEPFLVKTEGYLEAYGQRQDILMYGETVDGEEWTYTSKNGGRTWTREKKESDEESAITDPNKSIELWMKHAKDFREVGADTVGEYETTVYSALISSEYVKDAVDLTGGVLAEMDEDSFRDIDDLPITIWIDNESGYVVRMSIDMKGFLKTLMERAMEKSLSDLPEGIDFVIEVETASVDCIISQINAVPEIVIPDEARGIADPNAPISEEGSLIGVWGLYGSEDEETQQYVDILLSLDMDMVFEFREDGTGKYYVAKGEEISDEQEFEYTLENGQIVIDGEGEDYRVEGDLLYLMIGDDELIFKRK